MFRGKFFGGLALAFLFLGGLVVLNPATWRWVEDWYAPDYDGCKHAEWAWRTSGTTELWPWQAAICMRRYGGYRQ
jgi:hypothetical protein